MSIKDGIFVTQHVQLSQPLDAETITRAKEVRWEWVKLYNRLKALKGGGAQHAEALARAEQCIDLIDQILAANPTIN